AEVDDPAILQSLSEALGLPEALAGSLPPAYLVRAAEDAARLAAEHPGIAFVSSQRLWAIGGALHIQGREAAPGVLARESELEAIAREIPECETAHREASETLTRLVEERTRHASEVNRLRGEIAELQRETAVAQARRQDAEKRRHKLADEHQTIVAEDEEIATQLTSLNQDHEALSSRMAESEAAHETLVDDFETAQGALEEVKDERETLRTTGAGRRGRLELLEERLESHNQETARVRSQITYTHEQLEIWSREDAILERRLSELDVAIEQAEQELQGALETRAGTQEAVLEQQAKLDAKRTEIRALEEVIQGNRRQQEDLRSEISTLRVDRAKIHQDAEHLSFSYREAFKLAIPGTLPPPEPEAESTEAIAGDSDADAASPEAQTADEAAEPSAETAEATEAGEQAADGESAGEAGRGEAGESDTEGEEEEEAPEPEILVEDDVEIPELSPAQLAEVEADLARCKAILERIGPVNILAATEYEETLEREEFLSAQRRDVADSVRRLQATIKEINETSGERFRDTFAQVNAKFGELFARLFRGGEAEMRLFDEEDILETGIEIIARPPGKRPQNIMLLSGGEKALTAIALLFALFETKPSPFCILDEVDAPLDDVNVLRFVETLKEMAGETQFLIVTHNKLTMETASTLYGVTMEERGVSKLVAVEMENVHPVQQAATA
ncbi:MAG: hypothetical protein AAF657_35745, partial [Acidobacteriota bacterium]